MIFAKGTREFCWSRCFISNVPFFFFFVDAFFSGEDYSSSSSSTTHSFLWTSIISSKEWNRVRFLLRKLRIEFYCINCLSSFCFVGIAVLETKQENWANYYAFCLVFIFIYWLQFIITIITRLIYWKSLSFFILLCSNYRV